MSRTNACSSALVVVLAVALFSACAGPPRREQFGAALAAAAGTPVVTVAELLAAPERYDGAALVLEGEVNEVCLRKGCWMTLAAGERELRVTFQDYGFFVPTDCAGAAVRAA